jgi:hypothetical protein
VEAPVSRPALSMATRIALAELPSLVQRLDPDAAAAKESPSPASVRPRRGLLDRFGAPGNGTPARG